MKPAVLALAATLLVAAPAQATTVDGGTIVVGRGAAGAKLDMTRKQVIAKLGKPESQNGNGVLSYQPDDALKIFDVYRHYGKRVHRLTDETGSRLYVIKSRYHHRPVETQFLVDRFGRRRARVLDVFLLFTDRGP
jgi:hypothetical protein